MKTKITIGILVIIAVVCVWVVVQKDNVIQSESEITEIISETSEIRTVSDLVLEREVANKNRVPTKPICIGEGCDGSMSGESEKLTVVRVPLQRTDGENPYDFNTSFFYAPHTTLKTTAVLDATYKVLFDLKPLPELFVDGVTRDPIVNPVGYMTGLHYDSVSIQNGTAKVMLTGGYN